ncbi:MAG: Transcriptional regulator, TrmB [Candidatus Berkelbacteria bacterium Licking1014_2]|uniref:Transcriptional regulator, TrmB n=1 Tax=Candidatus Berkelbacteria bacterium Licking1014_2 TaxID=2017146 RepID=A0A554LRL4_9BACT|nr:MAG: Transcriptional regulator, TrmB [Candidatus Berkelbacteria bacterium Licking1014_2]
MSNEYENLLTQFGLKPQEAKVYLASLKLGQATVGRLAETADVQRTFVYDIVRDLSERGLMSQIEIRGKLHFSPVSLEQFQKIQENKLKKFAEILPELKALEKTTGDRPRVRFFEGKEGIRFALEDTLNQPNGGEILAYATIIFNDGWRKKSSPKLSLRIIAKIVGTPPKINSICDRRD